MISHRFLILALLLPLGLTAAPGTAGGPTPIAKESQSYEPDWRRYKQSGLFGDGSHSVMAEADSPAMLAAEERFLKRLNLDLAKDERRDLLLDLGDLYEEYEDRPKAAATYEKFLEVFPHDPIGPEIYMRLGFIYRDMGAFKTALRKFYSVLNASLAIDREEIDIYRKLSLKAQLEIADTHYAMGEHAEAAQFYKRLQRLELPPGDRALVDFKYAYSQYMLEEFPNAISALQRFIADHSGHQLIPECQFLLANSYKHMDQPREALAAVIELLQYQEKTGEDPAVWAYWKKRTGNELANAFYEQDDFTAAVKIYQAMAVLSDDPEWQWPVVYQLGMSFERLRMAPRSEQAYRIIIDGAEGAVANGKTLSPALRNLQQQAKWRLEHLEWIQGVEGQLNDLIGNHRSATAF